MLKRWYVLFMSLCFNEVLQSHTQEDTPKRINIRQTDTASSCSNEWYEFGEMCYKLGGKNNIRRLPWDQAAEVCRNDYNGHLATINSKEVDDFMFTYFALIAKENLWIGLHDRINETDYIWEDGTPASYFNWEPNEPSGFALEHEDCIEVVLLSTRSGGKPGQWNDLSCGQSYQFICQKEKGKFNPDYSDPKKCPGGGWKKNTSCFQVVEEEKTWSDAEEYCVQNFRGHLATITDFTIDLFLNYVLEDQERNMWIGIQTKNQHQQQWSSGWHVSFENWAEGEKPTEFHGGSCSARNREGKWIIHSCNKMMPFICEYSTVKSPILKPKTEGASCPKAPADWRDLGGDHCYYFDLANTISWLEANFVCLRRGGTLVSIHSQEETIILQNFLKFMQTATYYKFHYVHIGLYRHFLAEEFAWADGTPYDFRNWEANEPGSELELCVVMNSDSMKWHDIECKQNRGYVCSVLKVSPNQLHKENVNQTILHTTTSINGYSTSVLVGVIVCVCFVSVLISVIVSYFCFRVSVHRNSVSKLRLHYKKPKYRSGNEDDAMYANVI